MKSELNDLRERIYKNLKRKAYSLEGEVSSDLKAYRKDQVVYSKRPVTGSNIEELKKSVNDSDVVYLGDFHTFDQNIRNVLRILRFVASNPRQCVIGLEMVDARYQFCLDAYLERHLTELEFLESIHYHESWRFPWTHYKLIFDLAKEYGIKMLALNTEGTLRRRDEFAANLLNKALEQNENSQIVVVYGELHINADKIPALVAGRRPSARQTIIHQNLDEVYWTLRGDGQEDKIVKFNEREFCINSAPPWVKYESMIYWYENLNDDPDFDIHEYIIEKGKKIFGDDAHENFYMICQDLAAAAKIEIDLDAMEDFNLRDHTGLEFIEEKISETGNEELTSFYNSLIATGRSFRLNWESTFYCSSYSMNRICYLAGIHALHSHLALKGKENAPKLSPKDKEGFYIWFAMESLHAFFFSKIMNPHRKCDMYWNLERALHDPSTSKQRAQITLGAVSLLDGKPLKESVDKLSLGEIHTVAEISGHILGEYLYVKLTQLGAGIDLQKDVMDSPFSAAGFAKLRELLLSGLDYQNHKKRYF